jgi:hypothetical protein
MNHGLLYLHVFSFSTENAIYICKTVLNLFGTVFSETPFNKVSMASHLFVHVENYHITLI